MRDGNQRYPKAPRYTGSTSPGRLGDARGAGGRVGVGRRSGCGDLGRAEQRSIRTWAARVAHRRDADRGGALRLALPRQFQLRYRAAARRFPLVADRAGRVLAERASHDRFDKGLDRALFFGVVAVMLFLFFGTAPLVQAFPTKTLWSTCTTDCPANALFVLDQQPAFLTDVILVREWLIELLWLGLFFSMFRRWRAASPLQQRTMA